MIIQTKTFAFLLLSHTQQRTEHRAKIDKFSAANHCTEKNKKKTIWKKQKAFWGETGKNYHSADCGGVQFVLSLKWYNDEVWSHESLR